MRTGDRPQPRLSPWQERRPAKRLAAVPPCVAARAGRDAAEGGADRRSAKIADASDGSIARSAPCTCVKDGGTTFSEFIAQLLAQGRAPAWRFAPSQLRLDAGGTLQAHNRGGEDHTFTEVANLGGGCIEALNGLLGLTPVPECAGFPGGAFAATAVARRHGDDITAYAGNPPLRVPHPSLDADDRDRRLTIGTGARVPRSLPPGAANPVDHVVPAPQLSPRSRAVRGRV